MLLNSNSNESSTNSSDSSDFILWSELSANNKTLTNSSDSSDFITFLSRSELLLTLILIISKILSLS